MTDLILHVGHEKTGTSFLQATLRANRARLHQVGWEYPEIGTGPNHLRMAIAFADDRKDHSQMNRIVGLSSEPSKASFREELETQLSSEVKPGSKWIISTEYFATRLITDAEVSGLIAFLRRHFDTIKVVMYLRRQDFALASLYSQSMKAGGTKPLTWVYCQNRIYKLTATDLYWRWAKQVGPENVVARPYLESCKSDPSALLRDFCVSAGLPNQLDLELGAERRRNPSLSAEGAALLRVVNPYVQRLTASGESLAAHRRTVVNAVIDLTPGKSVRLTAELQERVREQFASSNQEMAAICADDPDWQEWLNQPPDAAPENDQLEISPKRVAELMVALAAPGGPVDWGQPNGLPLPQVTTSRLRRAAANARGQLRSLQPGGRP